MNLITKIAKPSIFIFTLLLNNISEGQNNMSLQDIILTYFNDVKLATKKSKKLWDKDLYGPVLLVYSKTRQVFANYPDSIGLLKKDGRIYSGYLPNEINIANYVIHWSGRDWSMIMMNSLSSKKDERVNLFAHELFHRVQPALGFTFIDATNTYLDEKDARIYLRLEFEALKAALMTKNEKEIKKNIADALIFRKYRHLLYPDADTTENWLELNEGIAEYTGLIIDGRNKEDVIVKLTQKIDGLMIGNNSFVRSFPYRTIPIYGYLLHSFDKYWNKKINRYTNLTDFFIKAFKIQIPVLAAPMVETIAASYNRGTITTQENEREERINKQIAEYKKKLIELPHLEIQCENMSMTANNSMLMPLKNLGIIYPSFLRIFDNWGILEVESGGVLMTPGRTKINLPAPEKIEGNIIKGSNWVLKLNEGYTVVKDENSGNYKLIKQ